MVGEGAVAAGAAAAATQLSTATWRTRPIQVGAQFLWLVTATCRRHACPRLRMSPGHVLSGRGLAGATWVCQDGHEGFPSGHGAQVSLSILPEETILKSVTAAIAPWGPPGPRLCLLCGWCCMAWA